MAIVARNGTLDSRFVRRFARACLACLIAWSRIGWEVRLVPRNVEHQVSAVCLLAANRCLSLPQCPPPRWPAHAPLWKSNLLSRGEQESISPTANILRPSQIKPRQRQLRDEVKSGGNQPTDIRVIHRRPSAARDLILPCRRTETTCAPVDLWTSPSDRHAPCGPCGQPLDNAGALPSACPHSRASRPPTSQAQQLI